MSKYGDDKPSDLGDQALKKEEKRHNETE